MNKRNRNMLFANPYILNGVVWLFVFLVYQLGWSSLCPRLSEDMMIFMTITVIASILAGVVSYYKNDINYTPIKTVSVKAISWWLAIIFILFGIEAIAAGGIPLTSYLSGSLILTYKEFGLPVVHVIVVNGLSVIILYSFYARRSLEDPKVKRQLLILMLLAFVPFILMFNRGAVMSNLIGIFLIVLLSTDKPLRVFSKLVIAGICIMFVFGALGNLRMGKKFNDLVLKVGQATVEFQNSSIPQEFFWGYLYIATPIANTQNTINHSVDRSGDSEDVENMILYEFTPELISKRITGDEDQYNKNKSRRSILLTENLNATSVYGRAYKYLGWKGMWMMFFFIMFFIFINMRMVSKKSKWYLPTVITLDLIIIMNLFDNMFIFMGMVPQLFIFIMIHYYQRYTAGMKKFKFIKRAGR